MVIVTMELVIVFQDFSEKNVLTNIALRIAAEEENALMVFANVVLGGLDLTVQHKCVVNVSMDIVIMELVFVNQVTVVKTVVLENVQIFVMEMEFVIKANVIVIQAIEELLVRLKFVQTAAVIMAIVTVQKGHAFAILDSVGQIARQTFIKVFAHTCVETMEYVSMVFVLVTKDTRVHIVLLLLGIVQ